MHARRAPDALQRPPQPAQRENLLLFVWLQDVAHLGEGLHVRCLRQRLGRQLIVGFEVSTNCRFRVSAEADTLVSRPVMAPQHGALPPFAEGQETKPRILGLAESVEPAAQLTLHATEGAQLERVINL
jgi:hypothetical protein